VSRKVGVWPTEKGCDRIAWVALRAIRSSPYRLINAGAEAVADFHVLRGKPAPHTLALKIRIEAFGKSSVSTRVADEAGVELEGVTVQVLKT
jgi:hypothetical protein